MGKKKTDSSKKELLGKLEIIGKSSETSGANQRVEKEERRSEKGIIGFRSTGSTR